MKVGQDVWEISSPPLVIRVPHLCYAGVWPPKLPYEEEDPYAIGDHGKGVPLGHALLAVQELT